ncbi:Sec7 domain-containing protein [Dichotomocladium elegans]|nr:Sec7 domain-containing protein [Dichotomocladium elegans]
MFVLPQGSHSLRYKAIDPPLRSSSLSSTATSSSATSAVTPRISSSCSNSSTASTTVPSVTSTQHDEAQSLLEWKRCSILRSIDWVNILVPTDLWCSDPFPAMMTEKDECQEVADRLWTGDISMIPSNQSMASFLGHDNAFAQCTLKLFLAKFDFTHLKLDDAFRKLCQKLYFKAEAQEIDRILEVFAHRYWTCNRHDLFGSPDIVYAVVYSLMLLNTDLHIATGHQRMSRSAFCKNTMNTLLDHIQSVDVSRFGGLEQWKLEMDSRLKELYGSVKYQGFTRPAATQQARAAITTTPETSLLQRMGSLRLKKQQREAGEKTEIQAEDSILEGYFICKNLQRTRSVKGRKKTTDVRECQLTLFPGWRSTFVLRKTFSTDPPISLSNSL